jgi:diguanylate cyclase (GGDEF)-like protein
LLKILIAEDDLTFRRALETTLTKWGYEVVSTKNGTEAWEILQKKDTPRLAILDWVMPEMDGVQVCQKVRSRSEGPYLYILLLTVKGQKEHLVEAMKAGADDYIIKPPDPQELEVRLAAGRRIIEFQEQLILTQEELRVQATRDSLTDLWNRSAIHDILRRELARAEREGTSVGIAVGDLDHFKRVNDTCGHIAGDFVLREAAKKMVSSVRPYDAVGRYGGEEFLIVLPGCDEQGVLSVAERIRSRIGEKATTIPEGIVPLTVSLGAAVIDSVTQMDAESLIHLADTALYKAKANGRNRVEFARPQTAAKRSAAV